MGGGQRWKGKRAEKINNDTSVCLSVSTSSSYFNDRSAEESKEQRLSLADTSTKAPSNIHQQDTESQVSHLFAPSSSCPWWSEVNSEEVFVSH